MATKTYTERCACCGAVTLALTWYESRDTNRKNARSSKGRSRPSVHYRRGSGHFALGARWRRVAVASDAQRLREYRLAAVTLPPGDHRLTPKLSEAGVANMTELVVAIVRDAHAIAGEYDTRRLSKATADDLRALADDVARDPTDSGRVGDLAEAALDAGTLLVDRAFRSMACRDGGRVCENMHRPALELERGLELHVRDLVCVLVLDMPPPPPLIACRTSTLTAAPPRQRSGNSARAAV